MRSTAKSNVVSENWENIAGPGEDPKGRRYNMVPISSSDFFFEVPSSFRSCRNQVEQHFAEISGVVCRRR